MAPLMTSLSIAVIALLHVCSSIPAPHPIVSRDTDKDPSFNEKLQRIHELLTQLESKDDEGDLRTVAVDSKHPRGEKVEAEEKEMRSLGLEDREKFKAAVESLRAPPAYKVPDPPKPQPEMDVSIQTLAHALAMLHQSQDEGPDSDGERLSTHFNEKLKEDKALGQAYQDETNKQLEETVSKALARLLEEQDNNERQSASTTAESLDEPLSSDFHREAIRIVEARLLRDITLANRLGLSVDDLIQDFEEQVAREETLTKLENSLASIAAGRDE